MSDVVNEAIRLTFDEIKQDPGATADLLSVLAVEITRLRAENERLRGLRCASCNRGPDEWRSCDRAYQGVCTSLARAALNGEDQ